MFDRRRLAPIIAGLAGLAWIWAELAPQRLGLEDTDDPAVSLRFLAADPGAWTQAGLALFVSALALLVTVIAVRDRLTAPHAPGAEPPLAPRVLTAIGVLAVGMLLAMAAIRMSGGPVRYVQGLEQGWGETAYLVTQFVGVHLVGQVGLLLLATWIAGAAWLGAGRRVLPRVVAVLAIIPAFRLLVMTGPFVALPGDFWWPLLMASIPTAFVWLVLLGATWPAGPRGEAAARTAPASAAPAGL